MRALLNLLIDLPLKKDPKESHLMYKKHNRRITPNVEKIFLNLSPECKAANLRLNILNFFLLGHKFGKYLNQPIKELDTGRRIRDSIHFAKLHEMKTRKN